MAVAELKVAARTLHDQLDSEAGPATQPFLAAFDALVVILGEFGKVFGFITADIEEKTKMLREHQSRHGSEFDYLEGMVNFEIERGTTTKQDGKLKSASRTLLRLVRALEFLADFLDKMCDSADSEKPSDICYTSYSNTLKKHHAWMVQKLVGVAVYALPDRAKMLDIIHGGPEHNVDELRECTKALVATHHRLDQFYQAHKLDSLP